VRRFARTSVAFLVVFGLAEVGVGLARGATTTYVPVLLDRIADSPALIGAVMLVNAAAGFAVPLVVGLWSDRRAASRLGRRTAFVVGGVAVTSAGLLAVAAGADTSYPILGLAAGCVYVGLNATATAHRAVIVERFEDGRRPAATSSQELAMLVGGLLGLGVGGVLISDASAAWLFISAAIVTPLLALPTVILLIRMERRPLRASTDEKTAHVSLRAVLRRPGAREVLLAQILWVAGYVALPVFFVLYADHVLDLSAGAAAAMLAVFGILTGAAMVVAGRAPRERVFPLLLVGAALLGGGLVGAAPAGSAAAAALPFACAAVGAGLVTALGFPYFARFVPKAEAGSYSGLYFSVRAIAATVAVPLAGLLIEFTGSYRTLMVQGAFALIALVPLALARTAERGPVIAARPLPERVAAVVPCRTAARAEAVVQGVLPYVDEVVLVDDGASEADAAVLAAIGDWRGVRLVRLAANAGKGDAVSAGATVLLSSPERPGALIVVDADGQHPPERIPDFIAASAEYDVVIGDRRGDRAAMPWARRCTNAISSALLTLVTGQRMLDSQCGMRLYRLDALERAPLPPGRYEAETRHLRSALRAGLAVGWVPIPAIYAGEESAFRPLSDTWRVLTSILAPRPRRRRALTPGAAFARRWAVRFGLLVTGTLGLAAVLPVLQPVDEQLFLQVNALGAGPDFLHRALDPHTRNYILLCLVATLGAMFYGRRAAIGVALATTIAALWADVLVQGVYMLFVRDRPEEVLGGQALLVDGGHWAHIASFPSGHMVVTTAIVVAAITAVPWLRAPFWIYCGLIALTRITFGAHFPIDVVAGIAFGYPVGLFAWELVERFGLATPPGRERSQPAEAYA
jgi:MFS family permease/membrane-associated phospholipid phosphatase